MQAPVKRWLPSLRQEPLTALDLCQCMCALGTRSARRSQEQLPSCTARLQPPRSHPTQPHHSLPLSHPVALGPAALQRSPHLVQHRASCTARQQQTLPAGRRVGCAALQRMLQTAGAGPVLPPRSCPSACAQPRLLPRACWAACWPATLAWCLTPRGRPQRAALMTADHTVSP